jgi:hypothetical protein
VELRRPRTKNRGISARTLFRSLGQSQGRWKSRFGWMMGRDVKLNILGVFAYSRTSGEGMRLSTISVCPFRYIRKATASHRFILCAGILQILLVQGIVVL